MAANISRVLWRLRHVQNLRWYATDYQVVTLRRCADYCKKDGDYKEFGSLPRIIKGSDVFKRCIDLAERGDLERINIISSISLLCKLCLSLT